MVQIVVHVERQVPSPTDQVLVSLRLLLCTAILAERDDQLTIKLVESIVRPQSDSNSRAERPSANHQLLHHAYALEGTCSCLALDLQSTTLSRIRQSTALSRIRSLYKSPLKRHSDHMCRSFPSAVRLNNMANDIASAVIIRYPPPIRTVLLSFIVYHRSPCFRSISHEIIHLNCTCKRASQVKCVGRPSSCLDCSVCELEKTKM